jgi:hypothetical protein
MVKITLNNVKDAYEKIGEIFKWYHNLPLRETVLAGQFSFNMPQTWKY